jgi:hypothetical protein
MGCWFMWVVRGRGGYTTVKRENYRIVDLSYRMSWTDISTQRDLCPGRRHHTLHRQGQEDGPCHAMCPDNWWCSRSVYR